MLGPPLGDLLLNLAFQVVVENSGDNQEVSIDVTLTIQSPTQASTRRRYCGGNWYCSAGTSR